MKNLDRPAHEAERAEKMKNPDWHKYSGWPPSDTVKEDKPRRKPREEKPAEESGE